MANPSAVSSAAHNDHLLIRSAPRPRVTSQQSNSLPATPRQHARDYGVGSRTPSPGHRATEGSPRSASSESNRPMSALRLAPSACRFMSTQTSRRRIPYTIGTDLLEKQQDKVKASLDPQEERKLSGDMRELYDRLLPPPENQKKREQVVSKLCRILLEEWPGKDIQVSVFGSSGNLLCTSKSDVDVCVIMKELETTCVLADVLARGGMQKVTCVHAKGVPIVKIWDPELKLACDLNLNNHVALTNTRMVRTYMELDDRVRPLAMIVKHWTSKRVINEASGGTLSSYTWTLLLINFLQTRRPPVLPVLTLRDHKGQPKQDFFDDLELLHGFGVANKETIGELLFHFFRRYGHEIEYQSAVISVRKGNLLSKEEKGWQLATNNMLCVEEPFNTERNLGNTADDTAFRGLHLEFRQAFQRIADGQELESGVFEQFHFPTGETRSVFERPQSQPRPVLTRSHSQSGKGGAHGASTRGNNRNHHHGQRTHANGRRASSAASYGTHPHPMYQQGPGLIYATPDYLLRSSPQDLQAHMQSQQGFQDQLSQLSQQLSREEQRLRMQQQLLLTQAQLQQAQALASAQSRSLSATYPGRASSNHNYRTPRAVSMEEPPVTAPLHRSYHFSSQMDSPIPLPQNSIHQGIDTNPSSPLLTPSAPFRRGFQRGAVPSSSSTTVRSQSQPARSIGLQHLASSHPRTQFATTATSSPQALRQEFQLASGMQTQPLLGPFVGPYGQYYIPSSAIVEPIPREYLGYGFGGAPQFLQAFPDQSMVSHAIYDDVRPHAGPGSPGPGTESLGSSVLDAASRTPSPLDNYELPPDLQQVVSQDDPNYCMLDSPVQAKHNGHPAPLIVNGSHYSPRAVDTNSKYHRRTASDSASHLHLESSLPLRPAVVQDEKDQAAKTQSSSTLQPSLTRTDVASMPNGLETPPQRALGTSLNGTVPRPQDTHESTGPPHLADKVNASPASSIQNQYDWRSNNIARHTIAPLDLATSSFDPRHAGDISHLPSALLSPVRETPTPSPTTSRKLERENIPPYRNGFNTNGIHSSTSPLEVAGEHPTREEHPPPTPLSSLTQTGAGLGIGLPLESRNFKQDQRNGAAVHTTSSNGMSLVASEPLPSHSLPRVSPSAGVASLTTAGINATASPNPNHWQLAPSSRKSKKNRASVTGTAGAVGPSNITPSTSTAAAAAVPEPMPLNEAERKGG